MLRKRIQIDKEKCVGCGLCVGACKQSAIEMVDGKAKVVHNDYCDGLGNCLPVCPVGAISFFDKDIKNTKQKEKEVFLPCGCLGTHSKSMQHKIETIGTEKPETISSQLSQWPIQIKLVPVNAPYFENADLLVAADCTAFAYASFHNKFIKNKVTIIGCPKLDEGDYTNQLTAIIKENNIKSVTAIRMEVPCCAGIENAVKNALRNSEKIIPWQVVTISIDGKIL